MQRNSMSESHRTKQPCMLKKFVQILLPLLGIVFVISCKKSRTGNDQSISLYHCSHKNLTTYICFDSLLEDSRCPTGADCFWSGTAIIKISFHENDRTHTITMSLRGFPNLGFPNDTIINGYKISFVDLKPYPSTDRQQTAPEAFFTISP